MMFETLENWALHAYADGELSGAELHSVEEMLKQDANARQVLANIRAQKASLHQAFDGVLGEQVPARLTKAVSVPAFRRFSFSQMAASAAMVIALVGGSVGWLAHGNLANTALAENFVDRALDAYAVYGSEIKHPVEVGAADKEHLQAWLVKRVGTKFTIPDLSEKGYSLIGGRLLADGAKPAGLLMYEDANKQRLAIYLAANDAKTTSSMMVKHRGDLVSCFWVEEDLVYALAGTQDQSVMLPLANAAHEGFDKEI